MIYLLNVAFFYAIIVPQRGEDPMALRGRSGFTRELLVLAVVGIVLASLLAMGIAAAARAVMVCSSPGSMAVRPSPVVLSEIGRAHV